MSRKPGAAFLAIVLAWITLDQLTKVLLLGIWENDGPRVFQVIPHWLDIVVLSFNSGAAFGLLHSAAWSRYLFIAIAVLTLLGMYLFRRPLLAQPPAQRVGLALVAGGAAGNLVDRLVRGDVIDFIRFKIEKIGYVWPDFNVADMGVTCGMTIYVVSVAYLDFVAARAKPVDGPTTQPETQQDAGSTL